MSYSPRLDMKRSPLIAEELRRMNVDAALCVPV